MSLIQCECVRIFYTDGGPSEKTKIIKIKIKPQWERHHFFSNYQAQDKMTKWLGANKYTTLHYL